MTTGPSYYPKCTLCDGEGAGGEGGASGEGGEDGGGVVVVDLRPPRSQSPSSCAKEAQVLGLHTTLVTFCRVAEGGRGGGGEGSEGAAATEAVVEAKVAWCRAALTLAFSFFAGPR